MNNAVRVKCTEQNCNKITVHWTGQCQECRKVKNGFERKHIVSKTGNRRGRQSAS